MHPPHFSCEWLFFRICCGKFLVNRFVLSKVKFGMLFCHRKYSWKRVSIWFSYFLSLIERNWAFSHSQHSGWNREEVGPNPGVSWWNPEQEAHCPVPRDVCTACPQHFPHPLTCWPTVVIFCPGMFIYPPFSHSVLDWPEDMPPLQGSLIILSYQEMLSWGWRIILKVVFLFQYLSFLSPHQASDEHFEEFPEGTLRKWFILFAEVLTLFKKTSTCSLVVMSLSK